MRRLLAPLSVALLLLLPAAAQAHGLVGRRDLPVPAWMFAWAATAVLVVSFVGLGTLWKTARMTDAKEKRLLSVPGWLWMPFGLVGVAALVLTIYAGFFGIQIDTANWAPTAIFVLLWVGIPFASLLVGDLYAAVNPLRAIGRTTGWVAQRIGGGNLPEALEYPARWGRVPAAVGLLVFTWVELAFPGRGDPSQLAVLASLFVIYHCIGMSLYGTDAWLGKADPFTVWFGWVAALSPLHWQAGTLSLRAPGVGVAKRRAIVGDPLIVIVVIGGTMWDGLSGGDVLGTAIADLAGDVSDLGLAIGWSNALVQTLGLLLSVSLVGGLMSLGMRGILGKSAGAEGAPSIGSLLRDFAPSFVPIGMAYAVGHYLSLLAFQGQAIPQLLSNPLGHEFAVGAGGWLGTAGWTINYSWLTANDIWYLQVGALLTGHVISLILGHDRAIERFTAKRAAKAQRVMLVLAVIFTCTGLWLLSAV